MLNRDRESAFELLRSLITNTSNRALVNFLYIECGFTQEEIDSWIEQSKKVLNSGEL